MAIKQQHEKCQQQYSYSGYTDTCCTNKTLEILTGNDLISNIDLAETTAAILRLCFSEEMKGLQTFQEVLKEGIGFHDLKDTWWLLLWNNRDNENNNNNQKNDDDYNNRQPQKKKKQLIGMITAIEYHNGLYLCNLCVVPSFQGKGIGLTILEKASLFAVDKNKGGIQNKLIGNANSNDNFILKYYSNLGAKVMTTGIGGGGGRGKVDVSSPPPTCVSVRLQKDIPATKDGVINFFASLRYQRLKIRSNHKNKQRRHRFYAYACVGAAGAITIGSIVFFIISR